MIANILIESMYKESTPILEHDHGQESEEEDARSSCGYFNSKDGFVGFIRKGYKHVSDTLSGTRVKGIFSRMFCSHNRGEKTKKNMGFTYDPRSYALNFDDGCDEERDSAHL